MDTPDDNNNDNSYLEDHGMQDVLARMPVAVAWASGPDGRIRFVNRKFTRMFGYTLADLSTVHEWILQCYVVPEQATNIDTFWARQTGDIGDDPTEMEDIELDILCKD